MHQDCPMPAGSLGWAYCRHSPGDEQDITSQIEGVRRYFNAHHLVLVRLFQDVAAEGSTTAGREEFMEMWRLSNQEPRPVDFLTFWSYSRFSRDILDSQFYIADFRRRGYAVFSITEPVPDGLVGLFLETAYHFASAVELERKREDARRGAYNVARQGYSPGGNPPVGYMIERIQVGVKSGGAPMLRSKWVPDPETFHLAKKAWQMRAEGATYYEIQEAIPGFYKQPRCWATFFNNETYRGVRKCGTLTVPHSHPAACTEEQWRTIELMRKRARGGAYPRQVRSPFVLSSLLECEYCHKPVVGSTTGSGYRYYVCATKGNYGWSACEAKSVSARQLDQAVVTTVLDQVLTPARFYELVDEVNQQLAADKNGLEPETQRKQRQLLDTGKRISNLLHAIADGSLAATEALLVEEKKQAQLQAEFAILKRRSSQQQILIDDATVAAKITQMRQDLAAFSHGDVGPTQKFIRSFVSRVVVGRKRGVLYYHIPLLTPRNQTELPKEAFPITSLEFTYLKTEVV